jgi:hypothetical protein
VGQAVYFVPTHHAPSGFRLSSHKAKAERLASDFKGETVVVLLALFDFLQRDVRDAYADRNLEIQCAGDVGYPWRYPMEVFADHGDRTRFLPNLVDSFLGASLMVTDGVGSHMFYAASLGVPVVAWPLDARDRLHLASGESPESAEYRLIFDFERSALNMNADGPMPSELLANVARRKLGFDALMDPDQLRAVLRWKLMSPAAGDFRLEWDQVPASTTSEGRTANEDKTTPWTRNG